MKLSLLAASLLASVTSAFTLPSKINGANSLYSSVVSEEKALTDNLKDLLEGLDGPDGGQKLLEASSKAWKDAIYAAVGAPDTANQQMVAKALQDAMSQSDNQFAILMGNAETFEANFPSDPVIDEKTAWVECRLRKVPEDELLVTMGINLELEDNQWRIRSLDWQDFRDAFYPGLSGREWLRAF